ncbi:aldo/keto reductase [Rothia uropygioeca]|uniref:aldo/keto reductase n=1 Tax=Kocuria sp. 257 TaxID=2021970 RepID=UPI0010124C95|nr:aldo/keto reductase [Kocuria sp. 257]
MPAHHNTDAQRPGGPGSIAGRTVARVGYGAMQLVRSSTDRTAAISLLRRTVELGVDHIDTAQFYGDQLVNEYLGEAIRPEDGVVIVSKVGFDPNPGGQFPMRPAQRPEELRASVTTNLRTLKLDQIPVVNLRRPEHESRMPLPADQAVDLDDQLDAMTAMREEGLIGDFGISNAPESEVRRAISAGIVCVQNAYGLLSRGDEAIGALCQEEGITWVPFFPLGSAFPGTPSVSDLPAARDVAAALGATPSQVGLAWLLHHFPTCLLIPGTGSVDHLEENIAAGSLVLDDQMLADLDRAATV